MSANPFSADESGVVAHPESAESSPALASPDGHLRTIVQLQQQAQALATELAECRTLEQALRGSEQELADFFDHAPMGLHWVGPDGRILRVNEAELRLLGYRRDEYLGHHIAEFHADPPVITDILRRLHAGEELHDYEARMLCKDGTIKYVLIDSNVLWEQGRFIHTRCFTRDITERTHTSEIRERLAAIVDSSDDAIIGHTLDGTITSWNQSAERLYGYTTTEVLGQPLSLLIPPDLSNDFPQLLARLQRGERIDHYETQRMHRNGSRLDVSLTISPIRDRTGQIIGASKIARDITERKRAEQVLHRERALLQALVDAIPVMIAMYRPDTQVVQLNREFERVTGWSTEEARQVDLMAECYPDPTYREEVRGYMASLQPGWRDIRMTTRDGRILETSWVNLRFADDTYIGVGIDITARKQAEVAQRFLTEASTLLAASLDPTTQLEQLARLLVPTLADWCCIDLLQEDGHIHRLAVVHADPAKAALAEQLHRQYSVLSPKASHTLTRVLCTGQAWFDPAPSEARLQAEARDTAHWNLVQALGFTGEIVVPLLARGRVLGTLTCVRSDMTRRYDPTDLELAEELGRRAALALDNARLYQEARTAQAALQQAHAVLEQRVAERTADLERAMAERQQAEAQLRQQQALLFQHEKLAAMSTMLASVAHELNNPLSVIMMQADLLQEEGQSPAPTQSHQRSSIAHTEPVQAIMQAAERAMRIVRNFLTLARQHPPERQAVALNTVVQEATELLAYALQVDSIMVDWQLAPELPLLWADPHQLQQVVVNLLTNAHQALREVPCPRSLSLSTRYDPGQDCVVLEVADTGPGMPLHIQDRIFEPFFTTKPVGVGTGLGLPLCRGIIEAHSGSITVESQPGQGTCFRITLPILAEQPPGVSLPALTAPHPSNRTATILVVDDEPAIARALAQVLRRDGHTVDTAANGRLALAKMDGRAYELVLCDLRMPDLDGPGLYQALQQYHPHLLPRIIFLTGDTLSPDARTFLEQTGVPRLSKPCRAVEVRRLVAQLLQHVRA